MAKKTARGQKSAAVREYLEQNPSASAGEVVAALSEKGIKVSQAMVYMIRSKSTGKASKKRNKAGSAGSNGSIEHGAKSEAVRAALRELGPRTPAKEIIDHLAAKGVKVSLPLVNKVKSREKAGRRGGRKARTAVPVQAARGSRPIAYEHLLAAKELADQLGGTESLRRTLDILDKLR